MQRLGFPQRGVIARVERADLQDARLQQRRVGGAVEAAVGVLQIAPQRAERIGGARGALPRLPAGAHFGQHYYTPPRQV